MRIHTRVRPVSTAIALTALAAVLAGCGDSAGSPQAASTDSATAQSGDTIVFAAVPSENSQSLHSQYGNLVRLLEKETGKKVAYQDATDYAAVIEGQRAGKIDIAGYGPFSYKIAKDSGVPIGPLAAGITKKGDTPGYHSTAWTRPDTGIRDLAGTKGKKVCFVDPASTSGNLVPSAGLLAVGIDPTKDLTQVFAGAHDASMISTSTGQCDAGFSQDSMMPSLIEKGQLKEAQLVQIWTSEVIPGSPLAMNTSTLDASTQETLKAVFQDKANVEYMTANGICSDGSCTMPGDATWGYAAVTDSTYDPIRKVCDATKASACNPT